MPSVSSHSSFSVVSPYPSSTVATNEMVRNNENEKLRNEKNEKQLETRNRELGWRRKIQDNTYFKIVVFAVACLTTSCVYFGWQPYSEMLWRAGAYDWRCEDGWDYNLEGPCLAQDKAVTSLYSYAQGTEFAGAFVAGLLLDHLGPRYTALLGECLFALATMFMMFSKESFQAYIPAVFISGLAVNVVSFPSLTVMERWPSRQALAVSIIVGAQSGASIVAPIMKWIWDRHPTTNYVRLWGLFLLCIWLPVTLVYLFALPTHREYKQLVTTTEAKTVADNTRNNATDSHDENFKDDSSTNAGADHTDRPRFVVGKEKWRAFLRDMATWDYCAAAVFMFLLMLQFAYYPAVVRDATSKEVSDYIGWMTPLQAPFSVVIGFIMDYTGTCLVMYGMCCTLVFVSLGCSLGPQRVPLQKAVGFIFIFMQSATYNLKYTFVGETFDPFNFGKLVGVLGIMGGIGVYCNAPISELSNYGDIFLYWLIATGAMVCLTSFLFLRQIRGVHHKTIAGVEQKHRVGFARAKGQGRLAKGRDEETELFGKNPETPV